MTKRKNPCKCCVNRPEYIGKHITTPGTKRHEIAPHAGKGLKWLGKKRVPMTPLEVTAQQLYPEGDA